MLARMLLQLVNDVDVRVWRAGESTSEQEVRRVRR